MNTIMRKDTLHIVGALAVVLLASVSHADETDDADDNPFELLE